MRILARLHNFSVVFGWIHFELVNNKGLVNETQGDPQARTERKGTHTPERDVRIEFG